MRHAAALLILLASLPAAGQINKCIINGRAIYQAAPCAPGARHSVIAPQRDVSEEAARENRERFLATDRVRQANNQRERLDAEIASLERTIDGYQKSMDAELAALKAKKTQASNNRAGATWEQSISTEMQAVTAKYQTRIQATQERIKALRSERDRTAPTQ